jgi:hypothetical protein
MLAQCDVIAFIATTQPEQARAFYQARLCFMFLFY